MLSLFSIFPKRDFLQFALQYKSQIENELRPSTYRNYCATISKFQRFVGEKHIDIKDIDEQMLYDFKDYLTSHCNNSPNTISENFKILSKLISKGYQYYKINPIDNPFLNFRYSRTQTSREFLEVEELKQFQSLKLKPGTISYQVLEVFMFECYTGLRISDILNLRWKSYFCSCISVKMRKTRKTVTIPLCRQASAIIDSHKSLFDKKDDFIFKLIHIEPTCSDNELDRAIASATVLVNTNLKRLATKAGIHKNISSHTGRHTFASLLINKGADLFDIKELLGHTDIKVTQIYTHMMQSRKNATIALLDNI